MPAMEEIARHKNDKDVFHLIGEDSNELLRWILFTCRSNFILLPRTLEFPQFWSAKADKRSLQFMTITASPEQENIFQQLKQKCGSRFLWHGSTVEKWHSIIRNGLKIMSFTSFMTAGAALGSGIYFAITSSISLGYTDVAKNAYTKSALGDNISIIALCEVINLPPGERKEGVEVTDPSTRELKELTLTGALNDHGNCFTLTLEEACIFRFIFVNEIVDVSINPPTNIPSINQVLKMRAHIH